MCFTWRPGRMVAAPTPKASTLVTEVTVMATPACWQTVNQMKFPVHFTDWQWSSTSTNYQESEMAMNESTKTMHFQRMVSFFKPEKSPEHSSESGNNERML